MINEKELLECMEEIKAIASSRQNVLTIAEIGQYLSGMDFNETQLQAIYRYLAADQITIEGYHGPAAMAAGQTAATGQDVQDGSRQKATTSPVMQDGSGQASLATKVPSARKSATSRRTPAGQGAGRPAKGMSKADRNLALYRREVSSLASYTEEQIQAMWESYLSGDDSIREELIHIQLPKVLHIAEAYQKHGIPYDELIAEGNIGILTAMETIRQNASDHHAFSTDGMKRLHSLIEQEIRLAIEMRIDDEILARDQESTILAKTNLLHEASKYLAEENGRIASREELAEYTRIPLAEVQLILNLSEDAKGISRS